MVYKPERGKPLNIPNIKEAFAENKRLVDIFLLILNALRMNGFVNLLCRDVWVFDDFIRTKLAVFSIKKIRLFMQ